MRTEPTLLIKKKISIARIINILSLGTLDGNEKQKYVNNIVDALDALPEQYVTERMSQYYLSGVEFIRDFFNERIKYLGPLREEPRSLYPLESNGSTFDLGLKGENTAAVFENYKTRKIKYISPKYFEDGIVGKFEPIESTLNEAINAWLVYMLQNSFYIDYCDGHYQSRDQEIRSTIQSEMDAVTEQNMAKVHAIRTGKSGNDPQLKINDYGAQRRDITTSI